MSPSAKQKSEGKPKRPAGVPEIALLERPQKPADAPAYMAFARPMPPDLGKLLERGPMPGESVPADGSLLHASARSASSHSTSPSNSTTSTPSASPLAPTGHAGGKKPKAKRGSSAPQGGKKKKAAGTGAPGPARQSAKPPSAVSPAKHSNATPNKVRPASASGKPSAAKANHAAAQQRGATRVTQPGTTPAKKRAPAKKPRIEESEVSDFAAAAAAAAAHTTQHRAKDDFAAEGGASNAPPASPRKRSVRPVPADAFQRLSGTNGHQDETLAMLLGLTGMRPQQRSTELASPNRFLAEGNAQRRMVGV